MSQDPHVITLADFHRQQLLNSRDPHAHARIDALQKVLAQMLSDLAISEPQMARSAHDITPALKLFAQADAQVAADLGLDP